MTAASTSFATKNAIMVAINVETNVNTVYSRLRAARRDFDQAVLRYRARDQWRER